MRWTMGVAMLLVSCAAAASVPRVSAPVREWKGNPVAQARVEKTYGQLPLVFEPNRGQVDKRVKWLARCRGYTLFLTEHEAVMALREGKEKPSSVVRMRLAGSRRWRTSEGLEATGGISNYFIGNDPKKWRTDIPHYRQVKFAGVYAGIDLVFYGNPQRLEYDLVVQPGADPQQIRLAYEGVKRIEVDSDGDLVLTTHTGAEVRQQRPRVYQDIDGQKVEVASKYQIAPHNRVSFELARYDRSERLLIDPLVLVYSTYLGGSGEDFGLGVAVDGAGSAYVTGYTNSTDFPTHSPYQTFRGDDDVFVTKLTPDGNALAYSTYLGGSSNESADGIAVDATGAAYVAGFTNSTDYPTQSPYQAANQGSADVFLTKLTPAGNALAYSTYLGGSGGDVCDGVAVDGTGSVYVTGRTDSTDFPTQSPYQATNRGSADVFVTKLTPIGDALAYSTYLGSIDYDYGGGIAVDATGSAYVTGYTNSTDFPTHSPYQTFRGDDDVFVTKLTPDGNALAYSTYLGGSSNESADGIAVDVTGSAYVTGFTNSTDYPTQSPYQAANQGSADVFLTKLTPAGNALAYSTYLGGSGDDMSNGVAVDEAGSAYVIGGTLSTDFPTQWPYQATNQGSADVFVTKLTPAGDALAYSTYLGGSGNESGVGIALDVTGAAYVTGPTGSTDFPTQSPYQATNRGSAELFVTKLEAQVPQPDVVTTVSAASFVPGAPLAPESIASGFGQGLAAATEVATTIPLPTTLANATVNVKDSADMERVAPLFFVSPGQINYLIPEGAKTGQATVTVTSGTQVVANGTLQIEAVAPGVFTANADGQGVAAAVAARYAADDSMSWDYVFQCGSAIGSCVPKPIDLGSETDRVYLQLYGTGIRGASSLSAVSAKIGGVDATVDYAGPAPRFVGLDQVNVRLPRSLLGRGEVEVVLTVDGKTANTVTASIK